MTNAFIILDGQHRLAAVKTAMMGALKRCPAPGTIVKIVPPDDKKRKRQAGTFGRRLGNSDRQKQLAAGNLTWEFHKMHNREQAKQ